MKIAIKYVVVITPDEVTEMLREANTREYTGTDREKLKQLLMRNGTCAIANVQCTLPKTDAPLGA